MPLPLPNLDTRRWSDLVDEGRALIPRYAGGWSDHNVHDPGITLIDLLAWLAEMDVYRLNRVPERHRRKFLALAGVYPDPPRAARALLGLAPPGPVEVPAGAEFAAVSPAGQTLRFRTTSRLQAVPASLQTLLVQTGPAATPVDRGRAWREQGMFEPLGDDPVAGAALWLGFDRLLPAGTTVQLGFNFAGGRSDSAARRRIIDEVAADQRDCLRPLPAAPSCMAPAAASAPVATPLLLHHSARLVWEFYAGGVWTVLDAATGEVADDTRAFTLDGSVGVRLPAAMTGLSVAGNAPHFYLRARLLAGDYDTPPLLTSVTVNAVTVEQALPAWQAFSIEAGAVAAGPAPTWPGSTRLRLQFRTNPTGDSDSVQALTFTADPGDPEVGLLYYQPATATANGAIILELVLAGRAAAGPGLLHGGQGAPDQRFLLPAARVQDGSVALYTLEPPDALPGAVSWKTWQTRPDFDASRGDDAHAVVEAAAAVVLLGSGDRGRVPPAATPLIAAFAATEALAGNVIAGSINRLAPTLMNWVLFDPVDFQNAATGMGMAAILATDPERVWERLNAAGYANSAGRLGTVGNPFAAASGAEAETVAHAAGRSVIALQQVTRAITRADYEQLALTTPGTAVARARALPGVHPRFPCLAAPGIVTVIVVPAEHRRRPVPSPGLLGAVHRYLHRRRLVGTHLEVVGPDYVTVQVVARVRQVSGAVPERLQAAILAAIDAFFDPLSGGPAVIRPRAAAATATMATSAVLPPTGVPGMAVLTPVAALPIAVLPLSPPPEPGWPFGRDVYHAEVLQVIDGVDGVDAVLTLELYGNGNLAECSNVCLGPAELVLSGQHSIEVVSA